MEILGYFASLIIGISLGLIGGGGSILTIPVLVYLFGLEPSIATGYSLFIVGCSSLAGAYKNYRRGNINFNAAFYFGTTSIITVLLIRKYVLQMIPDEIFEIGSFVVTKSLLTMLVFASIMILASFSMIQKPIATDIDEQDKTIHLTKALIRGLGVGCLTGFLGAGGGFLIIPVLIFSFHISMKDAIGTSLLIIAMNSLFGFVGDLLHHSVDWALILPITAIAVTGTFIGRRIGQDLPGEKLKKWFGWFIMIMGFYIIIHELVIK
jgi:hypothetical protein